MVIAMKRIIELEQELEQIDTTELIITIFHILGNKHSFRHRFFFALMYGISFKELVDMYNLINDKKGGDPKELVKGFNNSFPVHKDKIFELVACYKEEGLLTEFCDRFFDYFGSNCMGYFSNINDLFPQLKIE